MREYLVRHCGIRHPPDLGCTMPVDIGNVSDMDLEQVGVNYVLLTTPLPTSTEGKFADHLEELTTRWLAHPATRSTSVFLVSTCLSFLGTPATVNQIFK